MSKGMSYLLTWIKSFKCAVMVKASRSIAMEVIVGGTVLGVNAAHTKAFPSRIGT